MTAAIGGATAPAQPAPGGPWVGVRDLGAKADNGVTDNSVAFQAAVDSLAGRTSGTRKGVVFIPSAQGGYYIQKTVWVDVPYVEIRGEGQGTGVYTGPFQNVSHFQFGI